MQAVSASKLVIIAVVCGLLATGAAWMYLKNKEDQYRQAYKPVVEQKIALIVPRLDIAKAEVMTKEKVAVLEVPAAFIPSGAVLAQDWKTLEGRMVTTPLQKGKPITWSAVEGSAVSRFSENVELGKRAKTVKISKINSFDGLLRPGDHIDLLGNFSAGDIGLQKQPNYADDVIINVLENVVLLAAGREDASGRKYETFYDQNSADGFNMNFSTVTLMLTPQQVARVELAEKSGELVAVLRHPKDTSLSPIGQVTVANLLDPPPNETIDVVLDSSGNLVGRIVGDNVVDASGQIVGKVVDGKAVGFDGTSLGQVLEQVDANDPLLRVRERADVVRDAQGNVVGRVVDGQVIDASGKPIGTLKNGLAVGLKGEALGRVERNVALDARGHVVDMSLSNAQPAAAATEQQVVRDASGKVIGRVQGNQVVDANGQVVGQLKDGKAIGLDGKDLGQVASILVDAQGQEIGQVADVVRDASGKVIGRVQGEQIVDANGQVVGQLKDGKAIGLDGKDLGQVARAVLDAKGQEVVQRGNVVRDASGKVLGTTRGNQVIDSQGRAIGTLVDGQVVAADGKVLATGVSVTPQPQLATTSPRGSDDAQNKITASRMVQFIPGGTGKGGVTPMQSIRLE
ncbi:Flp pilus assembly protein CpaB [Pseudomonas cuatrocienegasensis]|uniref:Flp pilus assembly protein CpaB n=1 Tax=Pseudomonas cuatrocienegasensis TaxID=543360 RepID=A0ABY1B8Y6_9PSED|nr:MULTISPECIES: Flp pilus assembly protein CpaB [Pseudomonas]OEC35697.1 Flp pilus assembly protein CpaB [Pseudomonas sp. 21C1]SEQ24391.1 Flp pilus assembly protein CpaB [Pseudomonas cuatrocienegasensis]